MTRLVRFGVFVGLVLLGVALEPSQPPTDDLRFYVPAAQSYASWLARAWSPAAWSRAAIDGAFAPNHEHPPVAKYMMGLGWLVFHGIFGVADLTACRLPVIMLWAWTCLLIFRWVLATAGPLAAWASATCFVAMPRVLFDAHAETLDFTVTAFVTAAGWSFLQALDSPQKKTLAKTVALHALALGSKLNAPFAIAGEVVYWLLRDRPRLRGLDLRLSPIPVALLLVVLAAPILAIAIWPWMWFDTAARLGAYVRFHLNHYNILFFFAGTLYDDQPAPWYAPITMLLVTTPLVTLVLALVGSVKAEPSPLKRFAAIQIAAQLVAVCLPGTPKYGGVKLFLPVFPYLAMLAGLGFAAGARELARPFARYALLAACLLPSAIGVVAYRGYWLSYYNELIGGVRGATRAGFERQYYDLGYLALREALKEHAGNHSRVAVLPNPKEYAGYLRSWGFEPGAPETAKVVVLTHERRWPDYPDLQARWRRGGRLTTVKVGDVPLFSIYRGGLPERIH
jgi:4-amino-4-deoxy-L-arabinose transferase-like glycosyltransferase